MLVDPELLKAFSCRVDRAAADLKSVDAGHKAATAADGIPASTTQWAMRLLGGHIAQQANDIAHHVADMGAAVRGAGDKYEVDDRVLAGAFDGLF